MGASLLALAKSIYYQFQVHGKKICWAPRRTGVYDQMEQLLPIGNSTFAPTEISKFSFPKLKARLVSCYAYGNLNKLPWCPLGSRNLPQGTCDTCYQL